MHRNALCLNAHAQRPAVSFYPATHRAPWRRDASDARDVTEPCVQHFEGAFVRECIVFREYSRVIG